MDFNTDINKVKKFIENVKALGGGDPAEDVTGALKKGLE
jgi:hypothetical protein